MTDQEYSSDIFSDDESFDNDYYTLAEDCEPDPSKAHPEYFEYECLTVQEVEALLNEFIETLSKALQITPSLAKVILHSHSWDVQDIIRKNRSGSLSLWDSKMKPSHFLRGVEGLKPMCDKVCPVCLTSQTNRLKSLACEHLFCEDCWVMHFEVQITEGRSSNINCMEQECEKLAPEDFVLSLLSSPSTRDKYQKFSFRAYVNSHPQLRFCPGPNCEVVVRAKEPSAKQVICSVCKAAFCFCCGNDYHAPSDCSTIKKWLTKCYSDGETALYISTHTKSCPACHVSIEKNGGCNHVLCYSCTFEFCWMCLKSWKYHSSELYACSRYTRDPNTADEVVQVQAGITVQKYLHYYERWQNHYNSLKLEEKKLEMLKSRINENIMDGNGTWIEWHSVLDAATLLAKCRYTLQYTYPYAYYMEAGPRKELFEYQQAQLEAQIEDLSWKIERAENTHTGDLVNQMDVVEKWRTTLLKEFFRVWC